jgi:hypothetical protein
VVYANRHWNMTVTDVVAVERRGEPSVQSRFITAFLGLEAGVDDFTLPWLPRESRADEDGAFRDEPTAAHVVAGASPERASTGDARLRIEGEAVTMGPPLIVAAIVAVLSAAPRGSSKVNPQDGLTYQWIPDTARQLLYGLPTGRHGMLWPRTAPGEDRRCHRLLDRPHRGDPGGIQAGHGRRPVVLQRRESSGGPGRLDGRDDLLQPDRHAAAHGIGVGICRLRRNCRTAEGTAGIPSVVRPKQQGHYSSRSHEAAQRL